MILSPRLQKIAEYTGKCVIVADIGTDHALVPVYLIEHGLASYAYACDIGTLPLQRAERYIISRKLTDKIDIVLSDGLNNVPTDADVIIMAGMGGELIRDILARDTSHSSADLVLQPMTAADELRVYLYRNGYDIVDEDIVSEHNGAKLYAVMRVKKTGKKPEFDTIDTLLSPVLQAKTSAEKRLYIEKMISARNVILENIKNAKDPDPSYIQKISLELKCLEECL